jgi:ryanodine receptor 2
MGARSDVPAPLDTSAVHLPPQLLELAEKLAENAHEIWSKQRLTDGWTYGPERDDAAKKHPCLVPYGELPEGEKVYDRKISIETIKMIVALGFRIEAPPG